MFSKLDLWLTVAFAPVFNMLRDVPARAMTRLFAPF
jgi:hypothetical protein